MRLIAFAGGSLPPLDPKQGDSRWTNAQDQSPLEPGSDQFGNKVKWYASRVLPPVLGIVGLTDMILIRQVIEPWRLFACLGLLGLVPLTALGSWIGKK